ncbi:MAG: hypothetical protein U0031_15390 [Thermomicrobiales bacterium]
MNTPRVTGMSRKTLTAFVAMGLLGAALAGPARAQDDDTIVLTAGGSTLTVSPGHADAVSAVAEAHASPGHAHTKGAAAEAIADCEDGAMTRGAAALAVAHPDEGSATETLVSEIIASTKKDAEDNSIRKVVEDKCHKEKEKPEKVIEETPVETPAAEPTVVEVPVTGAGGFGLAGLSGLFAAAAIASGCGAVGLADPRRFFRAAQR